MNAHQSHITLFRSILAAAVAAIGFAAHVQLSRAIGPAPTAIPVGPAATPAATPAAAPVTAPIIQVAPAAIKALWASIPKVRIADTLTNPTSGPEWVDLKVEESLTHHLFMPAIMKPLPPPPSYDVGTPPIPAFATGMSIARWELSNDAGVNYVIPAALPWLPIGTRVHIVFDGAGPATDDYNVSDGLATLHSPPGMVKVFNPSNSQVSLYSSSNHTADTLRARLALAVLGG